jgi:hypothetical protein
MILMTRHVIVMHIILVAHERQRYVMVMHVSVMCVWAIYIMERNARARHLTTIHAVQCKTGKGNACKGNARKGRHVRVMHVREMHVWVRHDMIMDVMVSYVM